jgi:hypothetical protein
VSADSRLRRFIDPPRRKSARTANASLRSSPGTPQWHAVQLLVAPSATISRTGDPRARVSAGVDTCSSIESPPLLRRRPRSGDGGSSGARRNGPLPAVDPLLPERAEQLEERRGGDLFGEGRGPRPCGGSRNGHGIGARVRVAASTSEPNEKLALDRLIRFIGGIFMARGTVSGDSQTAELPRAFPSHTVGNRGSRAAI